MNEKENNSRLSLVKPDVSLSVLKEEPLLDYSNPTSKLIFSRINSTLVLILGFVFFYGFTAISVSYHLFSNDIIYSFLVLQSLSLSFVLAPLIKELRFSRFRLLILLTIPFLTFSALSFIYFNFNYNNVEYASVVPITAFLLSYGLLKLYTSMRSELSNIYHDHKAIGLWIALISVFVAFAIIYFSEPLSLYIPGFLIIFFTIIFTKRNTDLTAKTLTQKILYSNRNSKDLTQKILYSNRVSKELGIEKTADTIYVQNRRDKLTRPAILIGIFLIFMTLLFSLQTLIPLTAPQSNYAVIPQSSRIESDNIDFSKLEYYDQLDELSPLTINSKFIIKTEVKPRFGQSISVRMRLIPQNISYSDGYIIKPYYDISSKHLVGPMRQISLYTGPTALYL